MRVEGQIGGRPRKENVTCNIEFEWDKEEIRCREIFKR